MLERLRWLKSHISQGTDSDDMAHRFHSTPSGILKSTIFGPFHVTAKISRFSDFSFISAKTQQTWWRELTLRDVTDVAALESSMQGRHHAEILRGKAALVCLSETNTSNFSKIAPVVAGHLRKHLKRGMQ